MVVAVLDNTTSKINQIAKEIAESTYGIARGADAGVDSIPEMMDVIVRILKQYQEHIT